MVPKVGHGHPEMVHRYKYINISNTESTRHPHHYIHGDWTNHNTIYSGVKKLSVFKKYPVIYSLATYTPFNIGFQLSSII
jgi:hypothetical protein